jgi:hypothetical protein
MPQKKYLVTLTAEERGQLPRRLDLDARLRTTATGA